MSPLSRTTAMLTALVVPVALLTAAPTTSSAAPSADGTAPSARTSPEELARIDAVRTPTLRWHPCAGQFQCATAQLPLDYDHPRGLTVDVALLKVPAGDPARRIGSLFLNPGGPGGSGKGIAERAATFLSPEVRDRFDLIGMDPRGTNDSTRLQCFPGAAEQAETLGPLGMVFPTSRAEEGAFRAATAGLARACSTAGQPLASSMSTTEVARDLEVLRRAVGDRQLTYLGWSYGSYLGQMYANLYPDRVRAVAVDGVIDPVAWQGTPATRHLPLTLRLDSAAGASRALSTLLERCRQAGAPRCPLMPDPQAAFAEVADSLRAEPLTLTDEAGQFQITYASFVREVLLALYQPEALEDVPAIVAVLQQLRAPQTSPTAKRAAASRYGRVVERAAQRRERSALAGVGGMPGTAATAGPAGSAGAEVATPTSEPLANDYELNAAVACSDSRNPRRTERWSELAAEADRRSPYFGRYELWGSAVCARAHWRARDEDAYRGPFDRRTSAPVLVVGNTYDPATNVDAAVTVARRLPRSRLLLSDSWGHTAYGTSDCVTAAVDAYLVAGALPPAGRVCTGDIQPYAGAAPAAGR